MCKRRPPLAGSSPPPNVELFGGLGLLLISLLRVSFKVIFSVFFM